MVTANNFLAAPGNQIYLSGKSKIVFCLAAIFAFCLSCSPAGASDALADGKSKLSAGDYAGAAKELEIAVQSDPESCEAQVCLGKAYQHLKNFLQARQHFRRAIRVGHGSANAQQANDCLMSLPKAMLAPKTGAETRSIAESLLHQTAGIKQPTVVEFYADWCEPCRQQRQLIAKLKLQYQDRVRFLSINVDSPDSLKLVDAYDVSPIPTLIFLNSEGEVKNYAVGSSGQSVITAGLAKILRGS